MSSLNEKPVHHYPRILEAGLNLTEVRKVHLVVAFFLTSQILCLRESCMRENRTCSLSGGRRPARKRASSDPTSMNQTNKEERSSAEPGEKRARAKEKHRSTPHQSSTQRRERVVQGLSGVRGAGLLANPPRWEPYAVMPLVRFCAGGDQR